MRPLSLLRLVLALFLLSFLITYYPLPITALAQTNQQKIQELEKKKSDLSSQIQKQKEIAATKGKEAAELQQKIEELNSEIAKVEAEIEATKGKIDQTSQEISQLTEEIARKELVLIQERQKLDQALVEIYRASSKPRWLIILQSSSLTEVINQTKYLEALENQIEKRIEEITRLKEELEKNKSDLEVKRSQLESLRQQQEQYQTGVEIQRSKKNRMRVSAEQAKAAAEAAIKAAQKEYTNVNSELYRLQEIAKRRSGAGCPSGKIQAGINFQWPLTGTITTYFGGRTPFQPTGGHTGIDIATAYRTAIAASADGKVSFVGESLGYGNNVRIDHGGGYLTLYAHLAEFAVSSGESVRGGQTIGYEGGYPGEPGAGWSTGPHLHFEIRDSAGPNDPLCYLP